MLATPKKVRVVERREETVAAVAAKLRATRVAVVATRIAEVEIDFTPKNLQALIDAAMGKYLPDLPRVIVTGKPFSVMKKRLNDAKVKDVTKFINFAIREWSTLATQNQVAFRRDPSRNSAGTPLPISPSFSSLAYKLPYFIAAYANNMGNALLREPAAKSAEQQQIARLQATVAKLTESQKTAGTVIRRMKQASRPTLSQVARSTSELSSDWIPEWTPRDPQKRGGSDV